VIQKKLNHSEKARELLEERSDFWTSKGIYKKRAQYLEA
jgi:hypothetical protein